MGSIEFNEKTRPRSLKDALSCNIFINKQVERLEFLLGNSESAQDLRFLYILFRVFLSLPEIHNPFFEKIYSLEINPSSPGEAIALETLKQEVEAIVHNEYADEAPQWLRYHFSNHGGTDGLQ